MSTIAFNWVKADDTLYHMVVNADSGQVLSPPSAVNITRPNQVSAIIAQLYQDAQIYGVADIEFKVIQHGTPAGNIRGGRFQPAPHATSIKVHEEIVNQGAALSLNFKPQVKSPLRGAQLKLFKSALASLGLTSGVRGQAWEHHLWAVALHSSNSNLNAVIKRLWSFSTGTSTRTKVGGQQFQAWLASL